MPPADSADGTAAAARRRAVDIFCYFDNTRIMEIASASNALAALGHETRLSIFRLLVQAGPQGVNAGLICEKLDLAPATLSFHLAHLSRVGLIRGRQEGRFIFYVADYAAMDGLLAFLTDNCCQGGQCLPKSNPNAATIKRRRTASAS
jgi:ArsR family transcriptional regulator, arsenate/arsenite/antimonite-responsive transcriptional repressor